MPVCRDCSVSTSVQSRTGRCRKCSLAVTNADPEIKRRRREGIRARYTDADYAARRNAQLHRAHMAARRDPETARRLNQNIHIARQRLNDPDVRDKFLASRRDAGMKRSATCMAWCPPDKVEEYRRLTRSKRMHAEDAKRVILESLTPFEKQLAKVKAGASISEVIPFKRRADPDYSLTGGASRWMAS